VKVIVCAIFDTGIDTLSDVWMVSTIFKWSPEPPTAHPRRGSPRQSPVRSEPLQFLCPSDAIAAACWAHCPRRHIRREGCGYRIDNGLSDVGVKVTEMVQCASDASELPHVVPLMANWPVSVRSG